MLANRTATWPKAGMVGLVALTLAGCAAVRPDPQAAESDRFKLADSESAFGYEQVDWDRTPFWDRLTGLGKDSTPKNNTGATADAVATQAAPIALPPPPPTAFSGRSPKPQVGIYLADESGGTTTAYQLVNALDAYAEQYGMAVIKPGALTDALADPAKTCADPTSTSCRQTLAIYPGVRMLIILSVPAADNTGRTQVESQMADTDFGVDYPATTTPIRLAADDASVDDGPDTRALAEWSRNTLDAAAERIAVAPWFTHPFARKGNQIYVSAGSNADLKPGTILALHSEGSLVRTPGGSLVGWSPGTVVGRLEVKQQLGRTASILESISGKMPTPADRLTVAP